MLQSFRKYLLSAYCVPGTISKLLPLSSLQSSATFSQNMLSEKLGIYDGRETKEQDTEDPQLSLIVHWHSEAIFCRIPSFLLHQSSKILAGARWQGNQVLWHGKASGHLPRQQGWWLTRHWCLWRVRPSLAKRLHSGSCWGRWRPLALLGPMSQADVSSPNQLPISHHSCPHSPPSPRWSRALLSLLILKEAGQGPPWNVLSRTPLSQPLLQIPSQVPA